MLQITTERHDWVGKEIHWELYQKFKFDHTNKWYMDNAASILKMRHTDFSGIFTFKRITSSRQNDQTL